MSALARLLRVSATVDRRPPRIGCGLRVSRRDSPLESQAFLMDRILKRHGRMSRPLRPLGAGLTYHVMARGNNKMPIFLDDLDRARFRLMLEQVVGTFHVTLWIFCLMNNHFHFVLRTPEPNLSRTMQRLNGGYAQWWNRRHSRVGHMFQGRFKAQVVETAIYLVRLCRYVLLNPVRAGLCAHPGDWQWNSYPMLTGASPSDWVDVDSLLKCVGAGDPEGVRPRLIDYVAPETDPEMAAFIRKDCRVIGTPAFAKQFRPAAGAASREVPARERRLGTAPLADMLAEAVTRGEGLTGGIQRARADGLYSISEIARCAGLSRDTVQRILRGRPRVRRRPRTIAAASTALTALL
jgi:putative transposase